MLVLLFYFVERVKQRWIMKMCANRTKRKISCCDLPVDVCVCKSKKDVKKISVNAFSLKCRLESNTIAGS